MLAPYFALWGLQIAALSASASRAQQMSAALPHAKPRGHAGCSTNGQLFRHALRILVLCGRKCELSVYKY